MERFVEYRGYWLCAGLFLVVAGGWFGFADPLFPGRSQVFNVLICAFGLLAACGLASLLLLVLLRLLFWRWFRKSRADPGDSSRRE